MAFSNLLEKKLSCFLVKEGEGRPARTDWQIIEKLKESALLRCWPLTGRTHQIRVHLSSIGHVILGDATYGYRTRKCDDPAPERVLLHAERLTFVHPIKNKEITVIAPLPQDFLSQVQLHRMP